MGLTNVHSETVAGAKDSTGSCVFTGTAQSAPGDAPTYEETTAMDPSTCQETVMIGNPSSAALKAEAQRSANDVGTRAASASPNAAAAKTVAAGPQSAATTFTAGTYEKTQWVDPLYIIITSFAVNLKWQYTGLTVPSAGVSESKYTFSWDSWYGGVLPSMPMVFTSAQVTTNELITFDNDDFAAFIRATMGLGGLAACGWTTATAVFKHHLYLTGRNNGSDAGSFSDSATGACSNLVHHAAWHGEGSVSA